MPAAILRAVDIWISVLALWILASSPAVATPERVAHKVLVYYANNTPKEAATSPNYAAIRGILQSSDHPSVVTALEAIDHDAREAFALAERDITALRLLASRLQMDFIAFSNDLYLRGQYLAAKFDVVNTSGNDPEYRSFPVVPSSTNVVHAYSPLSRPDVLLAALTAIGELYPPGTLDVTLVVNTHGTRSMALIPRVTADFTNARPESVISELIGTGNDLALSWIVHDGVSKLEFWRLLASFSDRFGAMFSLVFLESCEGAPLSWSEVRSIPRSVREFAHSGTGGIRPVDIDYARIAKVSAGNVESLGDELRKHFGAHGVYVDTRLWSWRWAFVGMLADIPVFAFFLPLLLWLIVMAAVLATRRFARQGRELSMRARLGASR